MSHSDYEQQAVEAELRKLSGSSDELVEEGEKDLFGPAYATPQPPAVFWQDFAVLVLLGGVLGAFGYGYLKAISEVTSLWLSTDGNSDYPSAETLGFGAGRAWYIGLGTGVGLLVGLVKAVLRVDQVPSFLDELKAMHVEPLAGLKICFIALLGLMGGIPMGPEAGLGAVAGALGTVVGGRLRSFQQQPGMRRKLYVISCMASAFASFMPTPMVGILLAVELGVPPTEWGIGYMHYITVLAGGATASFAVYYAIAGFTYLNPLQLFLTVASAYKYDQLYLIEGMLFGIMGAALAVIYVVMGGVTKACIAPLKAYLDRRLGRWLRVVVLTTLGGAAYGALGWAMPLTLTDGSEQLGPIVREDLGSSVLAASCFAKALTYFICKECGFLGGLFMPMLAISAMLGRVFVNQTNVNPNVALACSIIAMGAGVMPAPFWLAILAISLLQLGPQGLVPVFACSCMANLLCTGVGIPQAIVSFAQRRKQAAAAAAAAATAESDGSKLGTAASTDADKLAAGVTADGGNV